jgi:hypothetical protein
MDPATDLAKLEGEPLLNQARDRGVPTSPGPGRRHVPALWAAVVLASAAPLGAQDLKETTTASPAGATRPQVAATAATSEIRIDGRLDEPMWQTSPAAADFVQAEPREGLPATEATDVWVAYDEENLYVAARLHDADPSGIVVNDIKKDFAEGSQDVFTVILDTFQDRRNGYVFMTNPGGARGDRQIAGEGREVNGSWDAIWLVETRIDDDGWTLEMAIPFRTLRFDPEKSGTWGINFSRYIRRKNEQVYWAPVPRSYNIMRLSLAGDLTGLPQASAGRDLRITPYALGRTVRETGAESFDNDAEFGGDLKFGVTDGLTLDLTANPDFAQVEADVQRVNLTQFSLFFQEKRDFFLENSGIFYVGDLARNVRISNIPRADEDLVVFFSRRIGIGAEGEQIPIYGGARITGRVPGGVSLGALWMRTQELDENPESDYGVVRLRKNLFAGSDIGGIFMVRNSVGRADDHNFVYGLDSYIRFPGDVDWSAYGLFTETPNISGGEYVWRTSLNREGNFHHIKLGVMQIGEGFNSDLSFYRRVGVRKYFIDWGIRPRPESLRRRGIREMHPHIVWNYFENLGGRKEAYRLHTGYTFFFESGAFAELSVNPVFERIEDEFEIDPGAAPIQPGEYGWAEWQLRGNTDSSKPLSVSATGILGGLWSGDQRTLNATVTAKPNYHFRGEMGLSRTDASLPEGDFVKTFWTGRVNYSFHKDMFIDALVQYDPGSGLFNSNVRFNFIHHPLSNLYIVWNEQRFTTGIDQNLNPGRSFIIKVTQMFAF